MVKSELFQKLWVGIEDMVLRNVNDALRIHEDVFHHDEDEEHDDGYGCEECLAKAPVGYENIPKV